MIKIIFFLIIFLSQFNTFGQTKSVDYNSEIGKKFKHISDIDVFKNYRENQGISIDESKNDRNGFLLANDGKTTLVLFNKYVPTSNELMILAIQNVGRIEKNTKIVMAECRLNLKKDGYIIALVKPNPSKEYFTNILKAWRVDKKTNQFISIPIKGIDCYNFEYENF